MSAALRLARPEDLDRLMGLVAAFHAEAGIEQDADQQRDALLPLLEGIPHGCIYLIGPGRAPLGYIILTFGWSVEFGGMDGFVDEIYIRPAVRGRGIATEVLLDLPKALAGAGLTALHLEVDRTNEATQKLYMRTGFKARERYMLMSRKL
ncbi:GNAT family N-acetyltransferase [Ruegeria sp. EL01]|jgi:ribosomal protein S18 acetylase RimI-like enzyme|uniref:GNAT family N-acetyltransferase n=1 Tax=Ruegeria sp. EL01 TaxID=2107578 RepID=UPI000EA82232|nr:GNAT family N-acetyltransferase [Ruegeria sp. EL01]